VLDSKFDLHKILNEEKEKLEQKVHLCAALCPSSFYLPSLAESATQRLLQRLQSGHAYSLIIGNESEASAQVYQAQAEGGARGTFQLIYAN
jgi:Na+-translocating ferredoxin:NAD+ oxidoreductase RnfG subunit